MPMESEKFLDVAGIRTRYFEKGEGEPVVLFHGGQFGLPLFTDAAEDWELIFDCLAEWAHVVAIDRLGQGFTDNPRSDADYTMDASVQHSYQTLQALGLGNAHLVGHSRGGYLVCRLTLEHPEIVKSCTIVTSNTSTPGTARTEFVFAGVPEPLLGRESQRWALEIYSHDAAHITDDWLDLLVEVGNLPKYREGVDKMVGQGLATRLFMPELRRQKEEMLRWLGERGLQRPSLQIVGYDDPSVSIEEAVALYQLMARTDRRARLHVINGAGHFVFREQPQAFETVLRCFVQAA